MSREDDLWCDWCGGPNQVVYRYDDRVFCSFECVRRYRSRPGATPTWSMPRSR